MEFAATLGSPKGPALTLADVQMEDYVSVNAIEGTQEVDGPEEEAR